MISYDLTIFARVGVFHQIDMFWSSVLSHEYVSGDGHVSGYFMYTTDAEIGGGSF